MRRVSHLGYWGGIPFGGLAVPFDFTDSTIGGIRVHVGTDGVSYLEVQILGSETCDNALETEINSFTDAGYELIDIVAGSVPGGATTTTVVTSDSAASIGTRAVVVASDDHVLIGGDQNDALLHVQDGSAGTVDAYPASRLVVESDGNTYLSLLSPGSTLRGLVLGNPTKNHLADLTAADDNVALTFNDDTGVVVYQDEIQLINSGEYWLRCLLDTTHLVTFLGTDGRLRFGNTPMDADAQVYHDGDDFRIAELNGGKIWMDADDDINITTTEQGDINLTTVGTNEITFSTYDTLRGDFADTGEFTLYTIPHAGTHDGALVTDGGVVSYRTGDEVLSDIGAIGGSGTLNYLAKFTPDGAHVGNSRLFDNGTDLGIGTVVPSSFVDIEKAGTVKATTDLVELTNTGNAADMDGTGTGILFRQWYYDAVTPAVADAGRISVLTKGDWTATGSTQDSDMSFSVGLNGALYERLRIDSDGVIRFVSASTAITDTEKALIGFDGNEYGYISRIASSGGMTIRAYKAETNHTQALKIDAWLGDNPSVSCMQIDGSIWDGNSPGAMTDVGDAYKILIISNHSDIRNAFYGNGAIEQHDPDCSHGMTDYLPTTAYSRLSPCNAAHPEYGGLQVVGASDSTGPGMRLMAIGIRSCSIHSYLDIIAGAASGTGIADINGVFYALRILNNATQLLGIYGDGDIVIGSGAAGHDYVQTWNGETNDGTITYMEGEDRFDFNNDVHVANALGVGASSTPTTAGVIRCDTGLGVGVDTTATAIGNFRKDQDAETGLALTNVNNHAASFVSIKAASYGSKDIGLYQASALCDLGFAGLSDLGISALVSSGLNGLLIENYSNGWLKLATNNTVRMTIAAGGGVNIAALAGVGTRNVVVDAAGNLSAP